MRGPVSIAAFLIASAHLSAQVNPAEFFEKRVRPVLAARCSGCHISEQLRSRAVGGKPDESPLFRAVTASDPKRRMPLNQPPLPAEEIADLRDWIQAGAPWPADPPKPAARHWAFQPLEKPTPPAVKTSGWARTIIDRFILAKLEEHGLTPGKIAGKTAWIRRATYDLTGLPPTAAEVDAFLADDSPQAYATVVDRLLASPHYGERWARHWLDVARYADGDGPERRPVYIGYGMSKDGFANTFRYRDWVIDAFNHDMPYDTFVKAQIAADLLPEKDRAALMPGLGFFGLGPWFTGDDVVFAEARANERDDKIDALSKGFLGLTIACARCHDHKYDPIAQRDYYALAGIFASSGYAEHSLTPAAEVARYQSQNAKVKAQERALEEYVANAKIAVAKILARQTADFLMAVRRRSTPANLDAETLARWTKYLSEPAKIEHPFLKPWFRAASDGEARRAAEDFQKLLLGVIDEKTALIAANEERKRNYKPDPKEDRALLPGDLMQFELFQFKQSIVQKVMQPDRFYLWLDVVQGEQGSQDYARKDGIYEFEFKSLVRFFTPEMKTKLNAMLAELKTLEKDLPPEYPYLMVLADNPAPVDLKLNLRGNPHMLGDVVPRGLPAILGGTPIRGGSGRLELAEAIVRHPLAARVIANRVWMHHFGRGIVETPSNFGLTGEPPTHPELLDYLAARLIENRWSIKALHREIMLSATYRLSAESIEANDAIDASNRYLWRANLRRLDAESLRDSLLFAAGVLDTRLGGAPAEWSDPTGTRRTIYGRIRRPAFTCSSGTGGVDQFLQLFDFPDPAISGDRRINTNVPLQGLFFLNSDLMLRASAALAARVAPAGDDAARVRQAYRHVLGRNPTDEESRLGLEFLKTGTWPEYAQVLLSSGAFLYVN